MAATITSGDWALVIATRLRLDGLAWGAVLLCSRLDGLGFPGAAGWAPRPFGRSVARDRNKSYRASSVYCLAHSTHTARTLQQQIKYCVEEPAETI
eukprot:2566793-Pyramimonas_sp.AAC.1